MRTKNSGQKRSPQKAQQVAMDAPRELIELDETRAEKHEMYTIYRDGNGVAHKIANFENPIICRTKGIIRIEAVKKGSSKQANFVYRTAFDSIARVIYGVPLGVDPNTKKIIWKSFTLNEFKILNLSNQNEAEEWAILKNHEIMKGARKAYRIIDEEEQAREETTKILLTEQAVGIAKDMKLKDWIPAVRFLLAGEEKPENMSPTVLQNRVMRLAQDTPGELIKYWKNENRKYIDLLEGAKAVGLVHHDYKNGWLFDKKMPMGTTWDDALRFLIKDGHFAKALSDKVKELDVSLQAVLGEKVKKSSFDHQAEESGRILNDLRFKARALGIAGIEAMSVEQLKARVVIEEKRVLEDEEQVEFVDERND